MASVSDIPDAVFIARAWLEDGSDTGLRVRIIHSMDLRTEPQTELAAASIDEVCTAVRGWLGSFLARSRGSST